MRDEEIRKETINFDGKLKELITTIRKYMPTSALNKFGTEIKYTFADEEGNYKGYILLNLSKAEIKLSKSLDNPIFEELKKYQIQ